MGGVDLAVAIITTLRIVIECLRLPIILLIVCTDLYSLYKCLVKLGITNEKCLIVDVLVLCQLYKRREIAEIQ